MSGEPASTPAQALRRARVATVLLVLAVVGGVAFWGYWRWQPSGATDSSTTVATLPTSGPAYAARFVGDKACRECHPGESAAHSRSGHARTLRPAAQVELVSRLDGRRVPDPEQPGVAWTYHTKDPQPSVERSEAAKTERLPLEFVFGSGIHALTFVNLIGQPPNEKGEATALEHRLSYYVQDDKLDVTTGQVKPSPPVMGVVRGPLGRTLDADRTRDCFACHATLSSHQSEQHLRAQELIRNVGCERCHGPGREHVEDARRGSTDLYMPRGLEDTDPAPELRFCGTCHRHPSSVSEESISTANASIVRFQPVGLLMSACYKQGLSGLRCMTCHDPHSRASKDHAHYENQCRSCHAAAPQRLCTVKPRPETGCVGCHMPRRKVPEGFLFTDHWIRVPGKEQSLIERGPGYPRVPIQ